MSISKDQQDINIILQNQDTLDSAENFFYLDNTVTYNRDLTPELEKQQMHLTNFNL